MYLLFGCTGGYTANDKDTLSSLVTITPTHMALCAYAYQVSHRQTEWCTVCVCGDGDGDNVIFGGHFKNSANHHTWTHLGLHTYTEMRSHLVSWSDLHGLASSSNWFLQTEKPSSVTTNKHKSRCCLSAEYHANPDNITHTVQNTLVET